MERLIALLQLIHNHRDNISAEEMADYHKLVLSNVNSIFNDGWPVEVWKRPTKSMLSLILAGQKLQAIKEYRETWSGHGMNIGLRAAKNICDTMENLREIPTYKQIKSYIDNPGSY